MVQPFLFSVFTQNKMKNMYIESLVCDIHNNPNWIQPKCPLADEWLNKCGKSMQGNTTQPQINSTMWVNLKIITLGGKNTEKCILYDPIHINSRKCKLIYSWGKGLSLPPQHLPGILWGFPEGRGWNLGQYETPQPRNSQRTTGWEWWLLTSPASGRSCYSETPPSVGFSAVWAWHLCGHHRVDISVLCVFP